MLWQHAFFETVAWINGTGPDLLVLFWEINRHSRRDQDLEWLNLFTGQWNCQSFYIK